MYRLNDVYAYNLNISKLASLLPLQEIKKKIIFIAQHKYTISIFFFQGTIDKDYPKTNLGYAFEIAQPAVQRILPRARVGPDSCHVMSVCRKDSQDLRDHDRYTPIKPACSESGILLWSFNLKRALSITQVCNNTSLQ